MAEVVTVATGDTLNKIMTSKRGVGNQLVFQWTELVRRLNPHISDVNRIFPNERILLPAHLQESVSPAQMWQNVFSHIPPSLTFAYAGPLTIYFVQTGDSIDSVAQRMFDTDRYRSLPLSAKRAVLLHNNPILERHLHTKTLPPKIVLDVTPVRLSQLDQSFWKCHQTAIANHLDQLDFELLNHYENTGPEHVGALTEMVSRLKDYGAGGHGRSGQSLWLCHWRCIRLCVLGHIVSGPCQSTAP